MDNLGFIMESFEGCEKLTHYLNYKFLGESSVFGICRSTVRSKISMKHIGKDKLKTILAVLDFKESDATINSRDFREYLYLLFYGLE